MLIRCTIKSLSEIKCPESKCEFFWSRIVEKKCEEWGYDLLHNFTEEFFQENVLILIAFKIQRNFVRQNWINSMSKLPSTKSITFPSRTKCVVEPRKSPILTRTETWRLLAPHTPDELRAGIRSKLLATGRRTLFSNIFTKNLFLLRSSSWSV